MISNKDNKATYYAHSGNATGSWHLLRDHLSSVSTRASDFLQGYNSSEEAGLARNLHDVGKYADRFQARLRGEDSGLDHWSAGASLAPCHIAGLWSTP